MAERRLLLDTHVWIWMVVGEEGRLSASCVQTIEQRRAAGAAFVSVVSVREMALLAARGRLRLGQPAADWAAAALEPVGLRPLSLDLTAAALSADLPGGFHRDPADQMLVAQAMTHGLTLVTCDEAILEYPGGGRLRTRDGRA